MRINVMLVATDLTLATLTAEALFTRFDVTCVANGADAISEAQAMPEPPDVVVTEKDLDGFPDGLAVLAVLRHRFPAIGGVLLLSDEAEVPPLPPHMATCPPDDPDRLLAKVRETASFSAYAEGFARLFQVA